MGRIKTTLIKRTTRDLIDRHGDKLKTEFEENKKLVEKYIDIPSTKIRNIIAGYVTRLMKNREN